jgi:hypothetical protein
MKPNTANAATPPADPLVAALARYVEALNRRYSDGPDQMRQERLAVTSDSANVVVMDTKREVGAA